jgi:hypothetical protein
MKDKTKQNLAALTAAVMAAYFLFNGIMMLGEGRLLPSLIGLSLGSGMGASLIAIYKKPTEGKLYNCAVFLGGLPSLVFLVIAIWSMFDGSFKPGSLFQLVVGVAGLLVVNMVINKDEEIENIEETSVETNE